MHLTSGVRRSYAQKRNGSPRLSARPHVRVMNFFSFTLHPHYRLVLDNKNALRVATQDESDIRTFQSRPFPLLLMQSVVEYAREVRLPVYRTRPVMFIQYVRIDKLGAGEKGLANCSLSFPPQSGPHRVSSSSSSASAFRREVGFGAQSVPQQASRGNGLKILPHPAVDNTIYNKSVQFTSVCLQVSTFPCMRRRDMFWCGVGAELNVQRQTVSNTHPTDMWHSL